MERQFEKFKRRVDDDPYGMLFGWRLEIDRSPKSSSPGNGSNHSAKSKGASFTMKSEAHMGSEALKSSQAGQDITRENGTRLSSSDTEKSTLQWQETLAEEFEFDPISMRKVPKRPSRQMPTAIKEMPAIDSEINILVKPFVKNMIEDAKKGTHLRSPGATSDKQPLTAKSKNTSESPKTQQQPQSWLAQEGFGTEEPVSNFPRLGSKLPKVESALDRLLRKRSSVSEKASTKQQVLEYKGEDNTTEDVDLLRASDIRALTGLGGKTPKETAAQKQERRKSLEESYETRPKILEAQFKREVASETVRTASKLSGVKQVPSPEAPLPSKHSCGESGLSNNDKKYLLQELEELPQREPLIRKKNAAMSAHQKEVMAQKAAMEELEMRGSAKKKSEAPFVDPQESREDDMASNVDDFLDKGCWYKQQGSHVLKYPELEQRLAEDKALIKEVRDIYEEKYGTIDTQHRQPPTMEDKENQEHIHDILDRTSFQQSPLSFRNASEPHGSSLNPMKDPQPRSREGSRSEELEIIRQLIDELRQTQRLFQSLQVHYNKRFPNVAIPGDILQSLEAFERSFMYTIKGAWEVFKSGIESSPHSAKIFEKPSTLETITHSNVVASKPASTSKPNLPEESTSSASSSLRSSYKILAYDPSTQRISTAKTSSLNWQDEEPLTLVKALSRLSAPAKFLPHLDSLHDSGYGIVSSGTNILIFKKVNPAESSSPPIMEATFPLSTPEKLPWHTNPIDGTTTQTGNFASPTGFVNHDAILPPSEDDGYISPDRWSTRGNDKVTRQEEVFSGSRTRWHERGDEGRMKSKSKQRRAVRRKRTLKRMVWVGAWVAGCCYAVGVASEFFKA